MGVIPGHRIALRRHPHPSVPSPSRVRGLSAAGRRKSRASQSLWFELMQFYIREAWLLDERRFKEWLDIFTDDVLYFMPRRKNVLRRELHREVTPLGDLAILEEDKRYLGNVTRGEARRRVWPGPRTRRREPAT